MSPRENDRSAPVAVIDIGSNSIKVLVAALAADGSLVELLRETEETRIGAGITGKPPRLREDAMERAIASIKKLLCLAGGFQPGRVAAVATSAVRDAANGDEFASRLFDATTLELSILSGEEEARLIGRGIACDPTMRGNGTFYLFDLGGGSLEMLAFFEGKLAALRSLQLGCVRVTEHCVPHPELPLGPDIVTAIRTHVHEVITASGFRFSLPADSVAVATGGTMTTFRAMQAKERGVSLLDVNPAIETGALERLAEQICAMPIAERRTLPGMPAARADVFPAALLTFVELAQIAGIRRFQHSLYNLRYGLARELLEKQP